MFLMRTRARWIGLFQSRCEALALGHQAARALVDLEEAGPSIPQGPASDADRRRRYAQFFSGGILLGRVDRSIRFSGHALRADAGVAASRLNDVHNSANLGGGHYQPSLHRFQHLNPYPGS